MKCAELFGVFEDLDAEAAEEIRKDLNELPNKVHPVICVLIKIDIHEYCTSFLSILTEKTSLWGGSAFFSHCGGICGQFAFLRKNEDAEPRHDLLENAEDLGNKIQKLLFRDIQYRIHVYTPL